MLICVYVVAMVICFWSGYMLPVWVSNVDLRICCCHGNLLFVWVNMPVLVSNLDLRICCCYSYLSFIFVLTVLLVSTVDLCIHFSVYFLLICAFEVDLCISCKFLL